MNEDATGSITALQAEIKRLREELEKARGKTTRTCIHVVLSILSVLRTAIGLCVVSLV